MTKQRLFITGIPTAGKSYLGKKLAAEVGGVCVSVDDIREDLVKDGRYKKWINFYLDQDEYTYYTNTSYGEQWQNLVEQSEGLWPAILAKIEEYNSEEKPVIFEGVNILPHLAHADLGIPGIVLLGESLEQILERNNKDPRWGKTEELQKLEADSFFNCERPRYKEDAEKYGYKVFNTPDEAWQAGLDFLS